MTKLRSVISVAKYIVVLFVLSSCTSIGMHSKVDINEFGQPEEFRICVYQDAEITDDQRDNIMGAIHDEFVRFGIDTQIPWVEPWERQEFHTEQEFQRIVKYPLKAPCDRYLVLLGRNAGDMLYGVTMMPEILGYVDDETMSKGVVVAEWGMSINMIVLGLSPKKIAIHETYHLLGCGHQASAKKCYGVIKEMKAAARRFRSEGGDFFPSRNYFSGEILFERQ